MAGLLSIGAVLASFWASYLLLLLVRPVCVGLIMLTGC